MAQVGPFRVSKVPLNSCHFHLMRLHLECGYTHRNEVMCPCPYLGWGAVNLNNMSLFSNCAELWCVCVCGCIWPFSDN